jgi:pSer/pThr/pTyr-binding forkhead associated (FHA) protein
MHAKLIVVGGKATKDAISLTLPIVIGRSEEADLTVGHRTISRRHAELFEADGAVMIRDLGSLNGVVIDGQRVKESPLPSGAQFTIGPLTFRVEYEQSADRNKPSPQVVAAPAAANNAKPVAANKPEPAAANKPEPVVVNKAVANKPKPVAANNAKPAVANKAAAASLADMPDFEPVDEEPAKDVPAPEKAATKGETEKKATVPTGDPFEDLLNELE